MKHMNKMYGGFAVMLAGLLIGGAALWNGRAVRASADAAIPKPVNMVVLMYHSVNTHESRTGDYVITPAALKKDLEYLKKEGYNTIVMSELIAFVHEGKPLPKKPVMITFDDGYYNNYQNAFPLLKEYNAKAVVSIIGTETDKFSELSENNQNYSHLTWDQIKEMQQSGLVEFQNHGYNMHKLSSKRLGSTRMEGESVEDYQKALEEDIAKLQARYTEMTGWTPNTYTYPFGRVSKESYSVITKLGFSASLDVQSRLYTAIPGNDACLYRIPRYNRACSTSAQAIIKKAFATAKKSS